MPNRIIREGILTSPKLAKLGWAEEVFYRRLLSVVDDFGRYYADDGMLRAACYPRQLNKVSDSDVGKWLRACVDAALVRVYPAEDGERYLEVVKFDQQVRAKKSKFPSPVEQMHSSCIADATQLIANAHLDVSVDVSVDEQKTGAPDGGAVAPEQRDPIWHTGLGFLLRKGIPEKQARQFLGKLKREAGDIDAASILAAAESEDVSDPIPWLSAAAVRARDRRQGKAAPSKTLNAIHQLEAMKDGLAANRDFDGLPEVALLGTGTYPGD